MKNVEGGEQRVSYHELEKGDRVRLPVPGDEYLEVTVTDDGRGVVVRTWGSMVVLPIMSNVIEVHTAEEL